MREHSLTVIMTCWDQYSDVRRICFQSLEKNFGMPYEFIIACNNIIDDSYKVGNVIICDKNSTGTQRLLQATLYAESKYLLMITEDALFTNSIDICRIEEVLDFIDKNNIVFCKMLPKPNKKGKKISELKSAKWINKRQAYGENLLCAIYEKEYLLSILGDANDTPWQLEAKMLDQAACSPKGYYNDKIVLTDNPLNVMFGVNNGKWNRKAVKKIKNMGLVIDQSRSVLSRKEMFIYEMKSLITQIIPIGFRKKIKIISGKIGVKFATPN